MLLNTPIKVLVVDDSLVFGRFLTSNLPKANSRIQIVGYAANAYEAIEKIPQCAPDVITMDVEMPKMNGIEFLKQVMPKHPIPVILVSAVNMNVFEALSNGAVDFVKKPNPAATSAVRNSSKAWHLKSSLLPAPKCVWQARLL